MTPPRPTVFDPEAPPPGYEKKLISFWQDRPKITPRLQLVHTNWAEKEGSIQASWNWANAGAGHTIPHLQVDRDGRGAMLLPLDRKGIANFKAADFSLGIETADRGTLADPPPAGSYFTDTQAETVAVGLAYIAWGYRVPLFYPSRWDGAGTACHTEPFGYPYWTNSSAKRCPGDRKKAQMRETVMPRARQILAAWTAAPPPPTPPTPPPTPPTPTIPTTGDDGMWFIVKWHTGQHYLIHPGCELRRPIPASRAMGMVAAGSHKLVVMDDADLVTIPADPPGS